MIKLFSYFAIVIIASFAIASCSTKSNPTTTPTTTDTSTTLTALALPNGTAAPDYNSSTIESIWDNASPLAVTAAAIGDNFSGSSFPVTIKSITSSQNIYFLVQYNDPSPNYYGQPLHFHGGNPQTASNWTLDATTYEDGVSLIFEDPANPGKSGSKTFTSDGCTMLCHTTTTSQWNKGMFSESNGGRYDLWYWHAGKGNASGYADDKISIGVPNFGISKDDDNAEIYHNNVDNSPGYLPFYVAGGANRGLDKQFFTAEETEQTFANGVTINPATNSAWKTDDIVPAFTIALPQDATNDYFDVHAKGYYSNGSWTVKFQRKLNTGIYNLDTQFASGNEYLFSFAIHNNNAPGNHYGVANKSFKLKIP